MPRRNVDQQLKDGLAKLIANNLAIGIVGYFNNSPYIQMVGDDNNVRIILVDNIVTVKARTLRGTRQFDIVVKETY